MNRRELIKAGLAMPLAALVGLPDAKAKDFDMAAAQELMFGEEWTATIEWPKPEPAMMTIQPTGDTLFTLRGGKSHVILFDMWLSGEQWRALQPDQSVCIDFGETLFSGGKKARYVAVFKSCTVCDWRTRGSEIVGYFGNYTFEVTSDTP